VHFRKLSVIPLFLLRATPARMSDLANTPKPEPAPIPSAVEERTKTLEEILRDKAPEVLNKVPPQGVQKLAKIAVSQTIIRQGPLPDPRELAAYNQIIPNGADRIMKMAEAQSAHRIQIESLVIGEQQKQSSRGQLFGLIIGLAGLGLGSYVGVSGQPWLGGIIAGGTVVSLVYAFVRGKQSQEESLEDKRPPTQERKKKNKR
jgi:uncharacterized membrane protein